MMIIIIIIKLSSFLFFGSIVVLSQYIDNKFEQRLRIQNDGLYKMVCRDPIPIPVYVESLLFLANEKSEGEEFLENRRPCEDELLIFSEGKETCKNIQPCPKLVEPFRWYDIIPYQQVVILRCLKNAGYCPTITEADCVSVPRTERERKVVFMLTNGTFKDIMVKEDTHCRCNCKNV